MREIIFRGKTEKGEWVYGLLTHIGNAWYISNEAGVPTAFEVIPATIGQYIGLTDKNGKKIFEDDICSFIDFHSGSDMETYCEGIFKFADGGFYITDRLSADMDDLIYNGQFDGCVIGNRHDNSDKFICLSC